MIAAINYVIAKFGALAVAFITLLPESPFSAATIPAPLISYANYVLPVSSMVSHLVLWLAAVLAYYLLRIPLRWMKVAEG